MKKKHNRKEYLFAILFASAIGVLLAVGWIQSLSEFVGLGDVSAGGSRSVVVDLEARSVTLREDGRPLSVFSIISIPSIGQIGYPVNGDYVARDTVRYHVARISQKTLSYVVPFSANTFFFADSGYAEKHSVGLSLGDASRLYSFVSSGTPITVIGSRPVSIELNSENFSFPEQIYAQSALVGDLETGEILYAREADKILPIASVSKLFTALVGQKLVSDQLGDRLYPLFLISSNITANQIAGLAGRDLFLKEMNRFAKSLGLANTSFADPSGLSEKNVSSARDLFELSRFLYADHRDLVELSRIPKYKSWTNITRFVKEKHPAYVGGKIGYTPEAGQTSISIFELPDGEFGVRPVAVIVLKTGDRHRDTLRLLSALDPVTRANVSSENDGVYSLLFAGDIMLDRAVRRKVEESMQGDYGKLFRLIDVVKAADISFANLEGPVSDQGYDLQNLYSFRMDPASLSAIRSAGFDALSVANNHAGDWGRDAFADTVTRLRAVGIEPVGGGDSHEDALTPRVFTRGTTTVAYLGFTDVGPDWLGKNDGLPAIALASDSKRISAIKKASVVNDVLVVSYHTGVEYKTEPVDRMRLLARSSIDAGADIVVMHHAHVPGPLEYYKNGVIAYGLGNFIFDQTFSEETMGGALLLVTIDKGKVESSQLLKTKIGTDFTPYLIEDYELSVQEQPFAVRE